MFAEDEDFSILLDALEGTCVCKKQELAKLQVLICFEARK